MEAIRWQYNILLLLCVLICIASCTNDNIHQSKDVGKTDAQIVYEKGVSDTLGNRNGRWVGYLSNDSVGYIGYYKAGLRDSLWMFFNHLGMKEKEEHYDNGLKNGVTRVYSDGILYDELIFTNDKKNGRHTHYYSTGKVNFYQEYKDGFFDGDYVLFFEDGKIKQKGRFEHGRCVGEWLLYSYVGEIIEKTIYDSISTKYREIKYGSNGEIISDEIK